MKTLEKLNRLEASILLDIRGGAAGSNTGSECTKYTDPSSKYPCGDVTKTVSDDCGNSKTTTESQECGSV
jgi:hypothetical protein